MIRRGIRIIVQAVLFKDNCITVVRLGLLWDDYVLMMRSKTLSMHLIHTHISWHQLLPGLITRLYSGDGFPRVHLHTSRSLTHQKLKIHNKLTQRWRPHLSVCSLHWCDLLSHQQLRDANFIIASCHTNWEHLIYEQHCEELQQMVKLSTIMTMVAKEHSVTGFLSLLCFPTRSALLLW